MKNPFAGMKVIDRDEDKEETVAKVSAKEEPKDASKKKRKVRPGESNQQQQGPEDNEGFEEVKKKKERKYDEENKEANQDTQKPKKKRDYKDNKSNDDYFKPEQGDNRGQDKPLNKELPHFNNPNKRTFDRVSGTGRGKDIKKGGFGGKTSWEGTNRNNIDELYSVEVDLNASKPKNEGDLNQNEETNEKTEEPVIQGEKQREDNYKDRRYGKKEKPEEEKEKVVPLFDIPENAVTYEEYLNQTGHKVEAVKEQVGAPLKNEDAKFLDEKKRKYKTKDKKEDEQLEVNFVIEDKNVQEKKFQNKKPYEKYEKPNQSNNNKNAKKGFKANKEEFPDL